MNSAVDIGFFLDIFRTSGETEAIIWKDKPYNYTHLLNRINYRREEFGDRFKSKIVGLESDFTPETIAILFNLIESGAIVVPFDIHHSEKNKKKYGIAELDSLIRIPDENNIEIETFSSKEVKNKLYQPILSEGKAGLVLFTSGSSGEPKGALHDFQKLLNKFRTKRKAMRTVNFLLFDHWGGLNTLFHILSNNGTVVILEQRNPDYVCEMIQKHQVELLPTSPTFLNMLVLSRAYERYSLSSLKLISYGAEPMPESLLSRLTMLFPHIKFQQTYGLIELGVLRSQSEENGSLWVKIGGEGYETRVVDNLLQIKSNSAMLGYLNAPSPFTEDGWFMTGDSVEVKGDYLKILGRKSEIINVGGEKVFPQEVENVILDIPEIEDVLVYSENNPLTGKIVCAKVKYTGKESKAEIIKQIKTHCRAKLQSFKVPVKIELGDQSFESGRFKKSRISGN